MLPYIAYVDPMGYIMDDLGVPHQHITGGAPSCRDIDLPYA